MVVNGATKYGDMKHFDAQVSVTTRAIYQMTFWRAGEWTQMMDFVLNYVATYLYFETVRLPPFLQLAAFKASRGGSADVSYEYLGEQNLVALQVRLVCQRLSCT